MRPTELQRLRIEAGTTHLHRLGARATSELLLALAEPGAVLEQLDAYRTITPEMLRAIGGDRFPLRLVMVPDEPDLLVLHGASS